MVRIGPVPAVTDRPSAELHQGRGGVDHGYLERLGSIAEEVCCRPRRGVGRLEEEL